MTATPPSTRPDLGMIEGRFGRLWTADERSHVVATLAGAGYSFYHYGPKGDRALRRDWRVAHDPAQTRALARLSAQVRGAGMRFGIALTPDGSTHPFDDAARAHTHGLASLSRRFERIGGRRADHVIRRQVFAPDPDRHALRAALAGIGYGAIEVADVAEFLGLAVAQ